MAKTYYIIAGVLYSEYIAKTIEKPSMILDHSYDTLLGAGEYDSMVRKYNKMVTGCPSIADEVMLVDISALTPEQQAYVLKRVTEYTATGFVTAICEHIVDGTFVDWVTEEMNRFPLDIY